MISYRDLLILKLSKTTQWKNAVEMCLPKSMMEYHWGYSFTCEFVSINDRTYILRSCYDNGNKRSEIEYKDGKKNGKLIGWYENGNKWYEKEYKDNRLNGKVVWWHEDGNKWYEVGHKNGQLDGKVIRWDENENEIYEKEYKDGVLIKDIK